MRVLLDECVPRPLRVERADHEVKTVAEVGWAGLKNGELLRRAETRFDVLLTVDHSLQYQHNFSSLSIAVVVIVATSNDVDVLRPFMPSVRAAPRSALFSVRRGGLASRPRVLGQRLCHRAARGALRVGFEQIGLEEIVSFTSVGNGRSRAVMERIGMRNADEDFEHPGVPEGHPLRLHCLYRISRARWIGNAG